MGEDLRFMVARLSYHGKQAFRLGVPSSKIGCIFLNRAPKIAAIRLNLNNVMQGHIDSHIQLIATPKEALPCIMRRAMDQ